MPLLGTWSLPGQRARGRAEGPTTAQSPVGVTAPAERASPGGWIPSQQVTTEPGGEQAGVGGTGYTLASGGGG